MSSEIHRSSTKQQNKPNKLKKGGSEQYKTRADEFKQPKSANKLFTEKKEDRMNRSAQLRKNKINEYLLKKRGLIDSDSMESSKTNISTTNLTALIDTNIYKNPPKTCALVALNKDTDLDIVMEGLLQTMEGEMHGKEGQIHKVNSNMWTALVPQNIYKGKERISFIKTSRNIHNILDICKVVDVVMFVTSCKSADYSKWKTDPDKYSHAIDEDGYSILTMLRAQGLPQHICVLQGLESIPDKYKTDIKKLFNRYFESELKPEKIFPFSSNDDNKAIIRLLCSISPFTVHLDLRKHRSYMLCEKLLTCGDSDLELYGYIRGNTLAAGNYIHLTGIGDYLVSNVEVESDPCPIYTHCNNSMKSLKSDSNKMELEKAILNDDNVENKDVGVGNLPRNIGNDKLVTNKQDIKLDDLIDFDIDIKDDGEELSFDEDEEDNLVEDERISKKHKLKTTLKLRNVEDMEFPDEVDTPLDMPARERFSKYRGLANMSQGTWDPDEDLPREYANIFNIDNIKNLYKLAVRKAHEEGMKIYGSYVKITLKNFNNDDLKYLSNDTPLILSTLLQHERKLCVMHYKICLNIEYLEPVFPKQAMETQVGFRRILTRPIYSSEINVKSDKLRKEKYLEKEKFYTATVYSQLTYQNSPVLFFRNGKIVASGSVLESDCKKIILKRIILTGYPVKMKKKKAVVRYMFLNPSDINYFKPIQLSTKHGLKGHITESLGTHGYMKCIFSDHIKANDTVCMNLYKRVFPKWFKESWKYKIFYGNRPDYMNYFEDDEKDSEMKID
jgi:pre-rRNA-processing protein TSR1